MRPPCRRVRPAGAAGGMTEKRAPELVPPRIAPLPSLPLFHKIEGKKAVVAGGSPGALWKAELLSAAGARVLVLAGHPTAAKLFEDLVARPINGPVKVLARRWRAKDLAGAVLAVSVPVKAKRRRSPPRRAGRRPGQLIDRTADCDVQFGTIVNRACWCWRSRPTARRRCSASRSGRASRRCCRAAFRPGRKRRSAGGRGSRPGSSASPTAAPSGRRSSAVPGPAPSGRRRKRISTR